MNPEQDHNPTPVAPTPWVPIRALAPRHRDRIAAHLIGQPASDRYLRFGYPASDEQIRRYVEGIDFDHDEVFGIHNRRLELIALAHLAFPHDDASGTPAAEFGVSVQPKYRGRHLGSRLFEQAMLRARNRGVHMLYIHALSENAAMLHIARTAGATVHRDGGESDAYLQLPPETLASQLEQWVGQGAAAIDYHAKWQAQKVDAMLGALGGVEPRDGASAPDDGA